MLLHKVCVLLVASSIAGPAPAQRLTESQIETAIKCGRGEVKCERPVLRPNGAYFLGRGFEVEVIPPMGRIYLAAKDAKDKYLPFSRSDVTEEMLAPVVVVRARNVKMEHAINVQHIVILPRGKKDGAVQPAKIEDWKFEQKNLMGASLTIVGRIAYFNITDLPAGDLDVVLVNDGPWGEQRADIRQKDRANLEAWSRGGLLEK